MTDFIKRYRALGFRNGKVAHWHRYGLVDLSVL